MLEANPADHQKSWLSGGAGRKLQELRIVPELLGSKEVDAVLGKVRVTLERLERELYTVLILYLFGSLGHLRIRKPPSSGQAVGSRFSAFCLPSTLTKPDPAPHGV